MDRGPRKAASPLQTTTMKMKTAKKIAIGVGGFLAGIAAAILAGPIGFRARGFVSRAGATLAGDLERRPSEQQIRRILEEWHAPKFRRLETERDGWLFACETLGALVGAGVERCRCNAPQDHGQQYDGLAIALLTLKERATCEAVVGFGAILTDLIGTRSDSMPGLYIQMVKEGRVRAFKMKRLVNRGRRLAAMALLREAGERG